MSATIKDASIKQKFQILEPFMEHICSSIKKNLKSDMLKKRPVLIKNYFPQQHIARMPVETLAKGYFQATQSADGEEIAEEIVNYWIFKQVNLYRCFADELMQINPQFDQIEEIEENKAQAMIEKIVQQFGALDAYVFSVLNSVAFSDNSFSTLRDQALAVLKS
ncbi:MAG: hypothetical protein K0S74_68 [Chlamydiales bacterium]|jgi:hypothetical protein|nr:hypothetical protein [Chlamydiales bacterium]